MEESIERLKRAVRSSRREPDFSDLERVLARRIPRRPVLFEFIMNDALLEALAGRPAPDPADAEAAGLFLSDAFAAGGFDAAVIGGWVLGALVFPKGDARKASSKSLNEGALIRNRADFRSYPWPDPEAGDLSVLRRCGRRLPAGMRLVVSGVEGVLETAVSLVGYDRLCLMLYEDPDLAADVFDAVGSRLLRFYERVAESDAVGACIVNDDWGFKTQTMLPPDHLRARVFPWTGRMVSACHRLGKPVILHSCGNLDAVMDDVIDVLRLDGKHSYEDAILPVERAFEQWGGRIAVVGGLDVDFLATRDPAEIRTRAGALARLSRVRGGLAVGSGNSIPSYVSMDRFAAMAEAVVGAG